MKKKIVTLLMTLALLFVNGCSCDKFDLETYQSAVDHLNNSLGVSYDLTVTIETEGKNEYYLEESSQQYIFKPNRKVEQFASNFAVYKIEKDSYSGDSAPYPITKLNRYYKEENNTFYTNVIEGTTNDKKAKVISYEDMYDIESEYNVHNLFPVFSSEFVSEFKIEKDESRDGYSIAYYKAECPAYLECDGDIISYKATIDDNFYFRTIDFVCEKSIEESVFEDGEIKTKTFIEKRTYSYVFNKYNSEVLVNYPDLTDYTY